MISVRRYFRAGGRSLTRPILGASKIKPTSEAVPAAEEEEGYAQVETLMLPKSRGGLKPGGITAKRPSGNTKRVRRASPLTVRASGQQKAIIQSKAKAAGVSVNRFVLASVLGSDYHPPSDPELTRALLGLNRELTAQGNNLNQIARQLNIGAAPAGCGAALVALAASLQQTHRDLRLALVRGRSYPDT